MTTPHSEEKGEGMCQQPFKLDNSIVIDTKNKPFF